MAEASWSVTKLVTVIGGALAALVIVGGGFRWAGNLDTRLTQLEKQFGDEKRATADALCLAVVQRQLVAIEKKRPDVSAELSALASKHRCVRDYRQVAAATVEDPNNISFRVEDDRLEFERALIRIDRSLKAKSKN